MLHSVAHRNPTAMMLFHCKPSIRRVILAFLMFSSTSHSQPNNERLKVFPQRNETSSNTTSSTQPWFHLSSEQIVKVNIVSVSVASLGVLLNFLVIVAIVTDPLKILRKGPWVTIVNLTTADFISSISSVCIYSQSVFGKFGIALKSTWFFLYMFGVSASFIFLTFLTVQIFLITKFPLTRRYCFTTRQVVLICFGVWLFAFPMGLGFIAYLRFSHGTCLKLYAAEIGVLQLAVLIQILLNVQVIGEIIRSGRATGNTENTKHRNIAKTVVILTAILFTTAFPYFILRQMEYFVRLEYFGKSTTAMALFGISYCFTPIASLNFTANPILYSLRLPQYRKTLLAFIGKRESGSRKRSFQNNLSKSTNAFPLQSQRTSIITSPQRSSLERSSMLQNTEQSL